MSIDSLRPRNWTLRVRLTALYGGLFFVAGAILLALTYLLVRQSLDARGLGLADPAALDHLPDMLKDRFNSDFIASLQAGIRQQQAEFKADTLDTLLTQGTIALGLVGVAAIGFGWVMASRVVRPLNRITETAGRIAAGGLAGRGLHERIGLIGPRDEITHLADTFDLMLERLDRSFDGQRNFVANASHELRTPLAINRALIELAVTKPDASSDARQLGESLLAINARHERLIDGLLTLADSETAIADRCEVDLADVVGHVAAGVTGGPGIAPETSLDPAPTTGDPVLLERLVQNLVENAQRHNHAGGWVRVATGQRDGWAELTVTNTGPVVPPYDIETIFKPFRRLAGERASPERGFGLGLSIVAAVAAAHGGTVTAVPRDGGGLVVTVRLPRR